MTKRIIPLLDYFIFAGKSSLDYMVRISGNGTYKTAERIAESVIVPGRNGDLTIDSHRFSTSEQFYEGYIVDDFIENYEGFVNFLLSHPGNERLEDSYHLDEFRIARFAGPVDPSTIMDEAGRFKITFKCQPQRYLKIGEKDIEITGAKTLRLTNPTRMTALPKIVVTSGTGTITIGSQTATLDANNGATVIDSELQDCYEGSTNRNANLTLSDGFPELKDGATDISVPAGMSIKIQPKWWRL